MVITVIPITVGMLIRNYKASFADSMEKPMKIASTVIFILVFIAVLVANKSLLVDGMKEAGLVTLLLNIITMALGYFTAKLFKLDIKSRISIMIESGIQNGTLAFVIAASILNDLEMGIPIGVYAIWMFITGGFLMWYFGRKKEI